MCNIILIKDYKNYFLMHHAFKNPDNLSYPGMPKKKSRLSSPAYLFTERF